MNTKTKQVGACVIIIGNEILSGRTQDKNLTYLAQILNEHGVQVQECRVIPDIQSIIVDTVNHCRRQFDYVITTGGIGPTHDDITTECIGVAFGVPLLVHPEIETIIHQRPAPEDIMESRMRMALVPTGAELVHSKIGPPGYRIENVFVLAGIPDVMQSMAENLVNMIAGGMQVHSRSVDAHLTESTIAKSLSDIQDKYPEVSLGSYPFFKDNIYGTSLVMRGTSDEQLEQVFNEVCEMIQAAGETPITGK